jgi:hypothetical protein
MSGAGGWIARARGFRPVVGRLPPGRLRQFYAGINSMDLHPDRAYADVGVFMGVLKGGRAFSGAGEYWDFVCEILEDPKRTSGEKARELFAFELALYFDARGPDPPASGVRRETADLLGELVRGAASPRRVLMVARTVEEFNRRALEEIVFLDPDRLAKLREFLKSSLYARGELRLLTIDRLTFVGTDVTAG